MQSAPDTVNLARTRVLGAAPVVALDVGRLIEGFGHIPRSSSRYYCQIDQILMDERPTFVALRTFAPVEGFLKCVRNLPDIVRDRVYLGYLLFIHD